MARSAWRVGCATSRTGLGGETHETIAITRAAAARLLLVLCMIGNDSMAPHMPDAAARLRSGMLHSPATEGRANAEACVHCRGHRDLSLRPCRGTGAGDGRR